MFCILNYIVINKICGPNSVAVSIEDCGSSDSGSNPGSDLFIFCKEKK